MQRQLASVFGASRVLVRTWLLPSSTMNRRLLPPLLGFAYIGVIGVLGGLTRDHVLLGMLGLLDLYNDKTRLFLRTFLPFIVTGAIFDSMRYFYWDAIDGRVHVVEPYLFDREWFGIGGHTLNEYFFEHHWDIADLASGFAYLTFVAEFIGMALLLFLRGHVARAATFARCFLVVNVMGFITYFVYPAAPPWYVTAHGLGPALRSVHPSAAAAHRFDLLLGTHFFDEVYGHGVDVFGAIPSLHSAYPIVAAVLAFRMQELRWARWPAVAFAALMWFSAVYLQHHYVIDVLFGICYGVIAVAIVAAWERRRSAPARCDAT